MILNREDYYSRQKHYAEILRTGTVGNAKYVLGTSGYPIGVAPTNKNGALETKADSSYPVIPDSTTGLYLTKVDLACIHGILTFSSIIVDFIVAHGNFPFNENYTTVNPPTIPASRLLDGSFQNTELWFRATSAFTGSPTLIYSYINQDGILKSNTHALGYTAPIGTSVQLPLADNDIGVQQLISIQCTVSTVGNFAIYIARTITELTFESRCKANQNFNFLNSGVHWLSDQSALALMNKQNLSTWGTMVRMEFVKA